jgi:hypothetical protein
LVNPFDGVEIRQQICPDEGGLFYNAMTLPVDLAQGNYRIRAYTRFMENVGEAYFFSKPTLVIPNEEEIKMELSAEVVNNKTQLEISFVKNNTKEVVNPGKIVFRLRGEKAMETKETLVNE